MSGAVYNFIDARTDLQSIIHLINLQGKDLKGLIIGIGNGEGFCTVLQNCTNVSKLYGVESWNSTLDVNKMTEGNMPPHDLIEPEMEYRKLTALHNIKHSGELNKTYIIEKLSNLAVEDFEDDSLDFIFMDTWMQYEQEFIDLESWYKKVKNKGIFAGGDWSWHPVKKLIFDFRNENNINNNISVFDNVWVWIK